MEILFFCTVIALQFAPVISLREEYTRPVKRYHYVGQSIHHDIKDKGKGYISPNIREDLVSRHLKQQLKTSRCDCHTVRNPFLGIKLAQFMPTNSPPRGFLLNAIYDPDNKIDRDISQRIPDPLYSNELYTPKETTVSPERGTSIQESIENMGGSLLADVESWTIGTLKLSRYHSRRVRKNPSIITVHGTRIYGARLKRHAGPFLGYHFPPMRSEPKYQSKNLTAKAVVHTKILDSRSKTFYNKSSADLRTTFQSRNPISNNILKYNSTFKDKDNIEDTGIEIKRLYFTEHTSPANSKLNYEYRKKNEDNMVIFDTTTQNNWQFTTNSLKKPKTSSEMILTQVKAKNDNKLNSNRIVKNRVENFDNEYTRNTKDDNKSRISNTTLHKIIVRLNTTILRTKEGNEATLDKLKNKMTKNGYTIGGYSTSSFSHRFSSQYSTSTKSHFHTKSFNKFKNRSKIETDNEINSELYTKNVAPKTNAPYSKSGRVGKNLTQSVHLNLPTYTVTKPTVLRVTTEVKLSHENKTENETLRHIVKKEEENRSGKSKPTIVSYLKEQLKLEKVKIHFNQVISKVTGWVRGLLGL